MALLVLSGRPGPQRRPAAAAGSACCSPAWPARSFSGLAVLVVIALSTGQSRLAGRAAAAAAAASLLALVTGTLGLVAVELLVARPGRGRCRCCCSAAAMAWAYRGHVRLRPARAAELAVRLRAAREHRVGRGRPPCARCCRRRWSCCAARSPSSPRSSTQVPERRRAAPASCTAWSPTASLTRTRTVAGPGDWPVARCLSSGEPLLGPRGGRDSAVAEYLAHAGRARRRPRRGARRRRTPSGTLFVGGAAQRLRDLRARRRPGPRGRGRATRRWPCSNAPAASTGSPTSRATTRSPGCPTAPSSRPGCRRAAPAGRRAAVLFMDLDRFKDVNDTLGPPRRRPAAQRGRPAAARRCRATATVARLGGDEFAVVAARTPTPPGALDASPPGCAGARAAGRRRRAVRRRRA